MKINRKTVVGLWHHMTKKHKTTVHHKLKHPRMKRMRRWVTMLRIMPGKRFDKCNMTLGKDIFLISAYGTQASKYHYIRRIETCVHEHGHSIDGISYFKYLTSKAYRARKETEAYKTNIIMRFVTTGELLDPSRLARILRHYKCTDNQIHQAYREFAQLVHQLKLGQLSTVLAQAHPAVKDAVQYLCTNE